MRVVVLGGQGNFGARICRALSVDDGLEVIAASRNPSHDPEHAGPALPLSPARLDCFAPGFAAALRAYSPDVVIHCVGPFQGQDYRVAEATLAAGAHYIDLADGRAFVAGFSAAMAPAAQRADRVAVTGASTLPALSSAVIDHLRRDLVTLETVEICIAPAQRAPRGAATLRSVFSYLGRTFPWLVDGQWADARGWQELKRVSIADFPPRWAAACDVPDLELLPARHPELRTVQFRAALELGVQHFLLAGVASLRRAGVPLPIERWAPALDRLASWLNRFGSERGGMSVRIAGTAADGRPRHRSWSIVADGNHGPEIPCMAAILLARRLARGTLSVRGAMPCMGLLRLDDFAPEFARWGMQTQIVETRP